MLSDSMGSVPVAAVRSAVEAAWRPLCVHADVVALSDIIEVVARVDRSVSRDGDDMFEDHEGDDKSLESDESDSSDGESSEGDEGSDEDEEGATDTVPQGKNSAKIGSASDSTAGAAVVAAAQGQKRTGQGDGTDDEDEASDGGLDDAAMFRIDKYLAKTFSTLKSSRQVCTILTGCMLLNFFTIVRESVVGVDSHSNSSRNCPGASNRKGCTGGSSQGRSVPTVPAASSVSAGDLAQEATAQSSCTLASSANAPSTACCQQASRE